MSPASDVLAHWRGVRSVRCRSIPETPAWMSDAELLLWALALEVDEHQATPTGERVCRVCGGRGEVIVELDQGRFIDPGFMARVRQRGSPLIQETHDTFRRTRFVTQPCEHVGKRTRPVTVELHRMIANNTSRVCGNRWPDAWSVDLDCMRARGLDDVVLPGRTEITPAWMCRWWAAFQEWSVAGKQPDAEMLSKDLHQRTAKHLRQANAFAVRVRTSADGAVSVDVD